MTNSSLHSDQYLIDGLAQNNSLVIKEIYSKYSSKMCNWIKQHNGDAEQAQDIFQEAIIDIYRKASQTTFELTCPFDAFLFAVIRNKWYSFLKSAKNHMVTNVEFDAYPITSVSEHNASKIMQYENQHKLLLQKLEELQEGCKEVLKLSWSGLGMEEVADKLHVTYAYVRKKKSLCMAKLIERIKQSSEFHQLSFKDE